TEYIPPVPPLIRGTLCGRHTTSGAGCNGRWPGVRRVRPPDETPTADGEVVWSWRRDRGVKLAGEIPPTTVARNAAHRGERERSRKTIARGKPGLFGCTCSSTPRVLSFCTRDYGCIWRPAFPAPSS